MLLNRINFTEIECIEHPYCLCLQRTEPIDPSLKTALLTISPSPRRLHETYHTIHASIQIAAYIG